MQRDDRQGLRGKRPLTPSPCFVSLYSLLPSRRPLAPVSFSSQCPLLGLDNKFRPLPIYIFWHNKGCLSLLFSPHHPQQGIIFIQQMMFQRPDNVHQQKCQHDIWQINMDCVSNIPNGFTKWNHIGRIMDIWIHRNNRLAKYRNTSASRCGITETGHRNKQR